MESLINKDRPLTDKNTVHSYIPVYEELFSKKKDTAKNILEIGINQGGSIKLWSDYFENARIYGLDVEETPDWLKTYERVTTFKENAYDHKFIKREFIEKNIKFDIIIDDGPHTFKSMLFAAKWYFQLLTKDGILVIEDVRKYEWAVSIIKRLPKNTQKKAKIIDLRKNKNRYDDMLIVFMNNL